MSDAQQDELSGPDFAAGVLLDEIGDGAMLAGHAHGKPVLVARRGDELFAVGAHCTHYGAPLADGLLVDDTVRCPWHHACFSLRTGEAVRAPALNRVDRWEVERRDGRVYVTRELPPTAAPSAERSATSSTWRAASGHAASSHSLSLGSGSNSESSHSAAWAATCPAAAIPCRRRCS